MLGTTESVFNPLPEDPNDANKKMPIPISILRQEAMQKKEKQYKGQLTSARSKLGFYFIAKLLSRQYMKEVKH